MNKLNINVWIGNKQIDIPDIINAEDRRIFHVLTEINSLGAQLYFDNSPVSLENVYIMSPNDRKKILLDTKQKIDDSEMLSLYAKKLKSSDHFWKKIADKSRDKVNLKRSSVTLDVEGVTVVDFLTFNQQLNLNGNSSTGDQINPEHYVFSAQESQQNVMENLGIIEEPTYFKLQVVSPEVYSPISLDKDTTFAMGCKMFLQSDGSDMKVYGLHQFKDRNTGLSVKLGIFFPEETPDFVISGHQEHLATEFYNAMLMTYNNKIADSSTTN